MQKENRLQKTNGRIYFGENSRIIEGFESICMELRNNPSNAKKLS